MQKCVSLIRSHLLIFALISVALGDRPKKTLVQFMSETISPMFSSRNLWCPVFKLLCVYFCVWCEGVLTCSNVMDLHVAVQLSQHPLPFVCSCLHCQRLTDDRCIGLFLGCLSCFFDPFVWFCAIPCCFDYFSFVVLSEVWEVLCLLHYSFSSGLLWQFGSL